MQIYNSLDFYRYMALDLDIDCENNSVLPLRNKGIIVWKQTCFLYIFTVPCTVLNMQCSIYVLKGKESSLEHKEYHIFAPVNKSLK